MQGPMYTGGDNELMTTPEDGREVTFWRELGRTSSAFVRGNFARILFGLLGLIVAILFLTLGFWKTALIALCVGAGVYLGGPRDRHRQIMEHISKLWTGRKVDDKRRL